MQGQNSADQQQAADNRADENVFMMWPSERSVLTTYNSGGCQKQGGKSHAHQINWVTHILASTATDRRLGLF
jgi:hypothetical protein